MFEYLIAAVLVSLISFGSGLIPLYTKLKNVPLNYWLAFAAGVLIATAFFEMIPASLGLHDHGLEEPGEHEEEPSSANVLFIALGFFIFYLIEQFITLRGHKDHYHEDDFEGEHVHHTGYLGIFALAADNIVDGASMAAAWLIDPTVGLFVTIAVLAHEIPHSWATVSILRKGNSNRKKIMLILAAVVTLFPLSALFVATTGIAELSQVMAFTAGAFIYFGASHLLPESHSEKRGWKVVIAFILGALMIYGGVFFLG